MRHCLHWSERGEVCCACDMAFPHGTVAVSDGCRHGDPKGDEIDDRIRRNVINVAHALAPGEPLGVTAYERACFGWGCDVIAGHRLVVIPSNWYDTARTPLYVPRTAA